VFENCSGFTCACRSIPLNLITQFHFTQSTNTWWLRLARGIDRSLYDWFFLSHEMTVLESCPYEMIELICLSGTICLFLQVLLICTQISEYYFLLLALLMNFHQKQSFKKIMGNKPYYDFFSFRAGKSMKTLHIMIFLVS
jgi:hypothetical protein